MNNIEKISDGMTGQQVADLVYSNEDMLKTEIESLGEKVDFLINSSEELSYHYCVGSWIADDLSPEVYEVIGDTSYLTEWNFYLIDTTDNIGTTTKPIGKLKRNNLLRFEDGTFAPTVGITEEMRAECDVELYLDSTHSQKYCNAGQFNAEEFYNTYGMTQKLYNASGVEVRILRPWETTETKYTIGIGRDTVTYLLDNVIGKSGKVWKGIFRKSTIWDGIDTSKYKLEPTAISPCPVCTIGNKSRSFFYLYEGETNCKSAPGTSNLSNMFNNGRTYPRTSDMNQITASTYARNNNHSTGKFYPFAEGGYLAYNTYITTQELLFGTKYLHKNTLFGSGISSNDSSNNEENWKLNGGVRYRVKDSETWKYSTWSGTGDICYNNTGSKTHFSSLLNQEAPKEQCMESQMAASFAVETGVTEGEEFEFYGGKYWYRNVNGLYDNQMNVVVYKLMTETISAFNAEGTATDYDIEVVLRMSLIGGVNLSGDIFAYWGGGYEQVGTCINEDGNTRVGNPIDIYLQPDQTRWRNTSAVSMPNKGIFEFESEYIKLGSVTNQGDGYASKRISYAPYRSEKGGSIGTGECYYMWDTRYWGDTVNTRYRIGVRSRGSATSGCAAPRSLTAAHGVSSPNRPTAGSAQVLIG